AALITARCFSVPNNCMRYVHLKRSRTTSLSIAVSFSCKELGIGGALFNRLDIIISFPSAREKPRKRLHGARDSFKFEKRCQLFLRPHNETLSVVVIRVHNPHRSPAGINR